MLKSKKRIVIFVISLIFILTILFTYKNKDSLFYGNTEQEYITSCQSSIKKSAIMSKQALYETCTCSYEKFTSFLGKENMKKFTEVIQKKDKELTKEFLVKEEINIGVFDSLFLSCF